MEAQRKSLAGWLEDVEVDTEPSLGLLTVVVPLETEIRKEPLRALVMESWVVGWKALVEGLQRRNVFESVELVQGEPKEEEARESDFVLRAVMGKAWYEWLLESSSWSGAWTVGTSLAVDETARFGVLLANIESLAKAGSPAKPHPALQQVVRAAIEDHDNSNGARETDLVLALRFGVGGPSGPVAEAEKGRLNGAGFDGDPVDSPFAFGGHLEVVPWHFGAWSLGFRAGYGFTRAEESYSFTDGEYSERYRAEFMTFHSVQGGVTLRRAVLGQVHAQVTAEAAAALGGRITTGGLSAGFAGEKPLSASFSGFGGRVGLGVVAIFDTFPLVIGLELPYDYLRIKTESRLYPDVPRASTLKGLGFRAIIGWRF